MSTYRKRFRDLEMAVHSKLREMVMKSNYTSKFVNHSAIELATINPFEELTIVDDRLTLLDSDGHHYDLIHTSLEELIDIVEPIK